MFRNLIAFVSGAFLLVNCSSNQTKVNMDSLAKNSFNSISLKDIPSDSLVPPIFNILLDSSALTFDKPNLHSFACGRLGNIIVLIGGKKNGFHSTSNIGSGPFSKFTANDSIWYIDFENKLSKGQPIPPQYLLPLSASNPCSYQLGNSLLYAGGFTRSDTSQTMYNYTSDLFIQFDISGLIQYINSGNINDFNAAIQNQFHSSYTQVTGGQMYATSKYIYLIGGQNYDQKYSYSYTGKYTDAIRRFSIANNAISDTFSLIDHKNLHRRDMAFSYVMDSTNSEIPVIFGGVFTDAGGAFLNPVFIYGTTSGNISIRVDAMQQKLNLYEAAAFPISCKDGCATLVAIIGGIAGYSFDTTHLTLVKGYPTSAQTSDPLPFSNMVDQIWSFPYYKQALETFQLPKFGPLLPSYIGSNAIFVPNQKYVLDGFPNFIDGNLISKSNADTTTIGYLYGGIVSPAASTTTASGHVSTVANDIIYEVKIVRTNYWGN
jgi:hypothetical protein